MSDITATLRLESPDLPLTETVVSDETASVKPVSGAGTVPNIGAHLFTVHADDFDRFETALRNDPTIESFERVVDLEGEAVYRFEYAAEVEAFSAAISDLNGVSLEWTNEGSTWIVRVWLPDRTALSALWEYATEREIGFTLERVSDNTNDVTSEFGLTQNQREAILLALEMGYFQEPRNVTLEEVATELGISQPAAGGRLRRGLRRLIVSTLAADADVPE